MRTPVTVVIPVWNAETVTRNCLMTLRETLGAADQVVVVDNGSRDGTPQLLAAQDWVEVVTLPENLGFAGGCNEGAARARHTLLVFLNNDTLPTPGWIEGLVAAFADPDVGAAGPMSNLVSGRQLLDDPRYRPRSMADIAAHADAIRRRSTGEVEPTQRLVGFCLAVRTTAFADLGGFDEEFGLGGLEDDDLCARLRSAGWRLLIVRDTFVHHIGHQTFDVNRVDWLELQRSNRARLEAKLDSAPPVSFVVLCGEAPLPLVATLVGIEESMAGQRCEVVLLVPDRAAFAEVLDGVGGVRVIDVSGLTPQEAWHLGRHRATGRRLALLHAGEAVHVAALHQLLRMSPVLAGPTHVGAPLTLVADG